MSWRSGSHLCARYTPVFEGLRVQEEQVPVTHRREPVNSSNMMEGCHRLHGQEPCS